MNADERLKRLKWIGENWKRKNLEVISKDAYNEALLDCYKENGIGTPSQLTLEEVKHLVGK